MNRIGNGLNNDGDTIYVNDSEGLVVDLRQTYGNDTLPARLIEGCQSPSTQSVGWLRLGQLQARKE